MSKSYNSRPVGIQLADTSARHGRIFHNHIRHVKRFERRLVTWGDLVAEFSERWYQDSHELVFAAFFGRFKRQRDVEACADDPQMARALRNLKRSINRYLDVKIMPDPGDEFNDQTLVGYHDYCFITQELAPCDYHPDNGLINRKLAQSLGYNGMLNSPEKRRCVWEVLYRTISGPDREFYISRSGEHRRNRRAVKTELRQATRHARTTGSYADEIELPSSRSRIQYWR